MNIHKFPYKWYLKDTKFTKDKGSVFSCFAGGGGSSLGYKLAGFDVIGFNEIDNRMSDVYIKNLNPKYSFIEPIQEFKTRTDLPDELYNLDILDASFPCSSYSMAGNREKDWNKEKKFREGQSKQILDTLAFDSIELANKLKPKIYLGENVKGLIMGNAKQYLNKIHNELNKIGYISRHWLLDLSKLGVPQKRERVFIIGIRKDLIRDEFLHPTFFETKLKIDFNFNETEIPFKDISDDNDCIENIPKSCKHEWLKMNNIYGSFSKVHERGSFFNEIKVNPELVCNTLTGQGKLYHHKIPRRLNKTELCKIGTFPLDYDFGKSKTFYIIGMSVPPVAIAQIATRLYEQILSKI